MYRFILAQNKPNILLSYLTYYITSMMYWYRVFTRIEPKIKEDLYKQIRKVFLELNKNHDIRAIKNYINYAEFKRVIKNPWWKYRLSAFIPNIFSLKNTPDKRHKVIKILGIKIKIKK